MYLIIVSCDDHEIRFDLTGFRASNDSSEYFNCDDDERVLRDLILSILPYKIC